jgi:hypothetical protein
MTRSLPSPEFEIAGRFSRSIGARSTVLGGVTKTRVPS